MTTEEIRFVGVVLVAIFVVGLGYQFWRFWRAVR